VPAGRATTWPSRLRVVLARRRLGLVVALLAVAVAVQGTAWLWHQPGAPGRALAGAVRALGWRWPLTLLLGAVAGALVVVWSLPALADALGESTWADPTGDRGRAVRGTHLRLGVQDDARGRLGAAHRPVPEQPRRQSGALVAGLAGGAITLWLNDHRRRHNQQELAQERDRIEEERFARAVELLGHDRAAVRVGAMHALAGLATAAPPRTQTVVCGIGAAAEV